MRVGPQWHADGSFERRVFSHVLFHAQAVPRASAAGPRCPTSPPPLTPCRRRSGRRRARGRGTARHELSVEPGHVLR